MASDFSGYRRSSWARRADGGGCLIQRSVAGTLDEFLDDAQVPLAARVGQTIVNVPDPKVIKLYVDDEPLLLVQADVVDQAVEYLKTFLTTDVAVNGNGAAVGVGASHGTAPVLHVAG